MMRSLPGSWKVKIGRYTQVAQKHEIDLITFVGEPKTVWSQWYGLNFTRTVAFVLQQMYSGWMNGFSHIICLH